MSTQAVAEAATSQERNGAEALRVAFVGPPVWLDNCCPAGAGRGLVPRRVPVDDPGAPGDPLSAAREFRPHVTVVLDPVSLSDGMLAALPGLTLGVLVSGPPDQERAAALAGLDRIVSFRPSLSGSAIGERRIWRAIPPPVSDLLYSDVRELRGRPRAIAVGRSTPHREEVLMPVKHHHDLLQLIHGVSGDRLVELLGEYDVGVYVSPEPGGGFGHQVGMHLAAGQLLLAGTLVPSHGLERNIDYIQVDSSGALVWVLDRLERFPEMYQRIRVRGRLKAEQYRASRLFARLIGDLLLDIAAFGRDA